MANLPISVSVNWKPFVVGFLVLVGLLYYFSGHVTSVIWKPKSPRSKTMVLQSGYVKIGDVEQAVFYQRIIPQNPKLKVLFLHGQKFTSENWKNINTLEFLSKKGYQVMAIDLPSYGKSQMKAPKSSSEKAKFLSDFIDKADYNNAVLVAPSMSGSYAIPFIFEGENVKKLRGFVPVAPVGTNEFKDGEYKKLVLPTMAVYGQNDKLDFVAGAIGKFKLIPDVEIKKIDNAGHACYLDKPGEFHSLMESFLEKLEKT